MRTHACEECARNCQMMHWNKMDLSPIVSRFFKIMIGKDFSKLLFLPPAFAKTVTHLVDQETKLEDSNGLRWPVMLSCVEKSVAFQRGWHDFSLNHNLQVGDLLIFNYIKGAHFVVHIFGNSACEKINSDGSVPPSKKARTKGNISSQGIPSEGVDTNVINRESSKTSVASGANLENSHIQLTTVHSAPISEGGNGKWSCLDSSLCLMIDRTCPAQGEERMHLHDLSSFELPQGKQAAGIKKKIDVGEGTSNHTLTSMRSQAEEDKGPIGTEHLNMGMFTEETDIGMAENGHDSEPKCNLSSFELQEGKQAADIKKGIEVEEGTSNHSPTSMRSQAEEDKDSICTEDLNLGMLTKETDLGMIGNEKDSEPKDNLCSFELQEGMQAAEIEKGLDVEEGTSNQTPTSMRLEAEKDKDPIGTEDLNMGMVTKETYIGTIENEKHCEPKDDMWLECESGPSTNLSRSLSLGPSCAKLGTKGDNMSNVDIQLRNAERSTENYGDIKKIVRKEQPEMREQSHGCAKRLRDSGSSTIKKSGRSSAAPYVGVPVKLEPVDSFDMPSSIFDTSACLAVTDGRNYLELPAELPAIRFRKGATQKRHILLQDKERRMWPALYIERSVFYILTTAWDRFNKANGIQAGDQYIFKVVDRSESIYSVDVLRQSEGIHLQGPA